VLIETPAASQERASNMKIKTVESQHHRDFYAIYQCEHCGHEQRGPACATHFLAAVVVPTMACAECSKKDDDTSRVLAPKYPVTLTSEETPMKKATLICDMQFGSTGKGLIAGYLAERDQPDVVITAWSMNAGHTYINAEGREFIHCMLANGIVSPKLHTVLIGPGSQIGINRLFDEADATRDLLRGVQILIHPNACVISDRHIEQEAGPMTKIGSTKKGCGAALIEKIQRNPDGEAITAGQIASIITEMASETSLNIGVTTHDNYCAVIERATRIQVEGAQGYSLGINSGFYPYTTSRECTPAQIASDCLLPIQMIDKVVGTMRTYPIRVANRYDEQGEMIGWSGPCYPDQEETTFDAIGRPTEMTTVTKLPRRLFTFSEQQSLEALRTVRPDEVVMGFANYAEESEYRRICSLVNKQAAALGLSPNVVRYATWGPKSTDIEEIK